LRSFAAKRGRRRPLTREEAGRLAASRLNAKPFRMTPARLQARRKGGRARVKQRRQDTDGLRLAQSQLLYAAMEKLSRRPRRKATIAEIAKATNLSARTVRRVKKWSKT